MKITYTAKNGISAEIEGKEQKDLFREIASFQEVFEETTCGACHGTELRFVVRTNKDGDDFFELHCKNLDCRSRLAFGQHKKGGSLYPTRKDKENKWLPKNGWTKWNPETKKDE